MLTRGGASLGRGFLPLRTCAGSARYYKGGKAQRIPPLSSCPLARTEWFGTPLSQSVG